MHTTSLAPGRTVREGSGRSGAWAEYSSALRVRATGSAGQTRPSSLTWERSRSALVGCC